MNNFSIKTCFIIAVAFISTGCAARYGCKAPEGKSCSSISQVYTESLEEERSAKEDSILTVGIDQVDGTDPSEKSSSNDIELNFAPVVKTASSSNTELPTKSAPKILRIWLAPWEDIDGDLHQPGYIYLQIDNGKWVY